MFFLLCPFAGVFPFLFIRRIFRLFFGWGFLFPLGIFFGSLRLECVGLEGVPGSAFVLLRRRKFSPLLLQGWCVDNLNSWCLRRGRVARDTANSRLSGYGFNGVEISWISTFLPNNKSNVSKALAPLLFLLRACDRLAWRSVES